jgi:hypothetical protein
MAGEIQRLNAAVVALTASIDSAVAFINGAKGMPAAMDAASTTIEAKTAELDTAVNAP